MATQNKKKVLNFLPRQKTITNRIFKDNTTLKEIENLKKLLSKEKIKILHAIKQKTPQSIYELSKLIKKDFKTTHEDIKFLNEYGIITLKKVKNGNRNSLAPTLNTKQLDISLLF